MKFLRKFNESSDITIKEEAENALSYLVDNGLSIHVEDRSDYRVHLTYSDVKEWDSCKYDIIQYLEYINSNYTINKIKKYINLHEIKLYDIKYHIIGDYDNEFKYCNVEDLDKLKNFRFWEIFFKIKKES